MLSGVIGKFCLVYIDDIMVYSRDLETHLNLLQQVFSLLKATGLTLNLKKCNSCQQSLSFLDHMVSVEGLRTEQAKVKAIQSYPIQCNIMLPALFSVQYWYIRLEPPVHSPFLGACCSFACPQEERSGVEMDK